MVTKIRSLMILSTVLSFGIIVVGQTKSKFPNPYYEACEWKVWMEDSSPVKNQGKILSPIDRSKRKKIAPSLEDGRPVFTLKPLGDSETGHLWDDVYVNQDNWHSGFISKWPDDDSSFDFKDQVMVIGMPMLQLAYENNRIVSKNETNLKKVGANFTSQSTTHMGHHITNSGVQVLALEQEFYFANVLRCGPAAISLRENNSGPTEDQYQALVPSLFNSYGASKSEMHAITKMIITGSFLKKDLKKQMKTHGIYPATLLYIWKKSLPYDVAYLHELRHRPTYFAKGDYTNYKGPAKARFNFDYHSYDEDEHLKNMVRMAYRLEKAPPVSVLSGVKNKGGKLIYGLRTAALIHQNKEDVTVTFSADRSYDIHGGPVEVECRTICGNPMTQIKELGNGLFEIKVPYDPKLPKGRTTVLVTAKSGGEFSNPAAINIYNESGKPNARPSLTPVDSKDVIPGEEIEWTVESDDPDGYPVQVFVKEKFAEGPVLQGNKLKWTTQPNVKLGPHTFTVLASDSTSGSCQNSRKVVVNFKKTVSELDASTRVGTAPLKVEFDGKGSRSLQGELSLGWTLDDVKAPNTNSRFEKIFTTPGVSRIELKAVSKAGVDSDLLFVESLDAWPEKLSNSWNGGISLTSSPWRLMNESTKFNPSGSGAQILRADDKNKEKGLVTAKEFEYPLRLDVVYWRSRYGRGAGIRMFDVLIGDPLDVKTQKLGNQDTSIAQKNKQGEWESQFISKHLITPGIPTRLRCYVTKDPQHESRAKFSGFIENEFGKQFFVFNNRTVPNQSKIEFLLGAKDSLILKELRVHSPK